MAVDGRDAGGSCVEIASALPITALHRAIGELDLAAVADGPGAATGTIARLEDRTFEACFPKLIRGYKRSDSSAQDDDFLPLAEVSNKLRQRRMERQ
jgi:hypothetical protein